MLLYPVYALLFADAGLSTSQVSSLFVIWSVVAFVFEVPSGALADTWSRRRLHAVGEFLTALGYALWIIWPAYPGFALGFVLWGLGGALSSGTLEALAYDELEAHGRAADYARISGRGGTVALLAMLAATLLAAPAYATGGYRLVGLASVAITTLGGLLALRLPESEGTPSPADDSNPDGYLTTLGNGLREAVKGKRTAWAVAVAALVPGFSALDEYLPLLARDHGAPTAVVPLLFALTALAMAGGSALAGRHDRRLGGVRVAAVRDGAGGDPVAARDHRPGAEHRTLGRRFRQRSVRRGPLRVLRPGRPAAPAVRPLRYPPGLDRRRHRRHPNLTPHHPSSRQAARSPRRPRYGSLPNSRGPRAGRDRTCRRCL
ncbi:MFS transporter [Micromonosporaceae bacterium Da 78-11]